MKHLIRGVSGEVMLSQLVGREQVLGIRDDYSVGPLPETDDEPLASWRARRTRYWGRAGATLEFDEARGFSGDPMTLWLALSPSEKLPAAWWCGEALRRGVVGEVRTVYVGVPTLGALSGAQLDECKEGEAADRAFVETLAELWKAWCAPDPAALVELSHGADDDLVVHAAKTLLDRYPDITAGLGAQDRRLLENVRARGPGLTRAIGYTLGDNWDRHDHVGDLWLLRRAYALADARQPHPLLELDPHDESQRMAGVSARLTADGLAVLEGRAHAITLNGPGFLEPIGGVRFDDPAGPLWLRTSEGVTRA